MKKKLFSTLLMVAFLGLCNHASALLYLGTFDGNDTQAGGPSDEFVEFLTTNMLEDDIELVDKSDEGGELDGFSPSPLSDLHDGTTGNVSYTGSLNLLYMTVKAGPRVHVYEYMDDSFDIRADSGFKNGISHISLWTGPGTSVPDGGTSIALFGLSMLGLGIARKRLKA